MIPHATPAARRVLRAYLEDVRRTLAGSPAEIEEVLQDMEDHVAEAFADEGRVDERAMRSVLDRLGPPEAWNGEMGHGQQAAALADAALPAKPGLPLALATASALATVGGIVAFPWVGPLVLLLAWVMARASLARLEAAGRDDRAWRWLLYPAPILVACGIVAVVLLGPVGALAEVQASRSGIDAAARVAVLLGAWWIAIGLTLKALAGPARWLLHPLPVRPRWGVVLALAGGAMLVVGLVVAFVAGSP